jgi:predicted SAM-dependent methyltransferase
MRALASQGAHLAPYYNPKTLSKLVRNIQIAPGDLPIQKPDWLRADIYTGDIYIDCTKRLPFPDNSVDLFFFEHFLEHLHYEPAVQF